MQIQHIIISFIVHSSYKAIKRKIIVRECQTHIALGHAGQLEEELLLLYHPAEHQLATHHQLSGLVIFSAET